MKIILLPVLLISLVITNTQSQSLEYFDLGDITLESGEVLFDTRLGYRTFGEMNHDSSNVIIFPTWFGGTSAMLSNLIGPDKLVDDTAFFVIAIDALGNGISTSPSNSELQPEQDFPGITIGDMVHAQYRLLTEKFDLNRIHGAIGGSMGGMQVFEWLIQYPGFIQRAVPYVSTPKLSSYDLIVWHSLRELIESGVRYNLPDREIMKLVTIQSELLNRTPDYFHENYSPGEIGAYFASFEREYESHFTLNNYLLQLHAILNHDISRQFDNQLARAVEIIDTNLLIIVAEMDLLVHPAPAIEMAEIIQAGLTILENDCGHLAVSCERDYVGQLTRAFFAID